MGSVVERRRYFLLALIAISALLAGVMLLPFASPLAGATMVAILLNPLHVRLMRRGWGEGASAGLLLGATMVAGGVVLATAAYSLFGSIERVYDALFTQGRIISAVLGSVENVPLVGGLLAGVIGLLGSRSEQILRSVVTSSGDIVPDIAAFLFSTFVFFIALFYCLRDGARWVRQALEAAPLLPSDREIFGRRLSDTVDTTIRGALLVALLQGVAAFAGYVIFGVPYALLWSVLTAVSSILPVVGPVVIYVPITIYLYVTAGVVPAVLLFVYSSIVVFVISNVIWPRMVGKRLDVHPVLILFAVIGGISIFGILGLFLGPLVFVVLFSAVSLLREAPQ